MNDQKLSAKEILESAAKQLRSEFDEIKQNNPHAAEGGAEVEIVLNEFLQDYLRVSACVREHHKAPKFDR